MKKKAFTRIRMLIGMALISSFATTSYAQFNLDKLKSLAEQAKAYQEKLKQGSTEQSSPATLPQGMDSAAQAATGGQQQVDIVGVKIGMTPSEALKVLRAHNPKLAIIREQKVFFEDFEKQNHPWQIILQDQADNSKSTKEMVMLYVSLPPSERVVQVIRELEYPRRTGGPSVETVESMLKGKYGIPKSAKSHQVNSRLVWHYDLPQRQGYPEPEQCYPDASVFRNFVMFINSPLPVDRCGLTMFGLIMKASGNPGVVQSIRTQLTDHAFIYRSATESVAAYKHLDQARRTQEIQRANQREVPKF